MNDSRLEMWTVKEESSEEDEEDKAAMFDSFDKAIKGGDSIITKERKSKKKNLQKSVKLNFL